jgi:uncharacterized protein (TIGR02145 family)
MLFSITIEQVISQGISVNQNGNPADPSAILDVSSPAQGILLPRLTQAQIGLIANPANGLIVFCTTDNNLYVFLAELGKWKALTFGNESITPSCGGPLVDARDGQVYPTVQIGTQCWMKKNLNYGSQIPGFIPMANNQFVEKYCYEDNADTCMKYGALYTWDEAMNWTTTPGDQGICPAGWKIPTDNDFKILEGYVDSFFDIGDPVWDGTEYRGLDAGKNLKTVTGWLNMGNVGADLYGFSALPGGGRYLNYYFYDKIFHGYFWTSDQFTPDPVYAWYRLLLFSSDQSYRQVNQKEYGYSVRCLKE